MSLINEALKKAQRRHDQPASPSAEGGPGGPVVKRAQPKSAKSMLVLAAGAIALVVLSMVGTALWLTRSPAPAAPTGTPKAATPVATVTPAPEPSAPPVIVVPPVAPTPAPAAVPTASPGLTNTAIAQTPAPVAAPSQSTPEPAPLALPLPAPAAAKAAPTVDARPDERIQQYVDALKVMGIRSSGSESKVLMNDRVFRVNDIVDRTLGVKLTKVAPDSLTFTDANGATYVKYF